MKICRFNERRLGVVVGEQIADVTAALDHLPEQRWPLPFGDPLIANLPTLLPVIRDLAATAPKLNLADVALNSPVATPSKIVAAPANYRAHVEQDTLDPEVDHGFHRQTMIDVDRPVDKHGLFLKAASSLVGPAEGVVLSWPDPSSRTDHEVEIALVIGRVARRVPRAEALGYLAGYAIGMDITARGVADRSFRKSGDTFSLLGPWLSTPDEIADPDDMHFWITVDGEKRQASTTAAITVGLAELIEIASHAYTLYPGDIILSGTPEGVGPLKAGQIVRAGADGIGEMTFTVSAPDWA